MHSKIQVAAAALILAGCATAPPPQPATPQPTPSDSARSDAAPAPPATPRPPPTAAEQQQANKIALRVADLLEAGNEVEAHAEIDRALSLDPNSKLALNFQRQMTVDPRATLGEESFAYTVKPGESLSKIAGRFLGDIYGFYLLARYNDIKVPRQVSAGQTIRVPGKAPPPEAKPRETRPAEPKPRAQQDMEPPPVPPVTPPAPPPQDSLSPAEKAYREGLAAQKVGNKDRAYQSFRQAEKLDPSHAEARTRADQLRRELVQQHERNARSAMARQDLDGAVRNWDRVLEIDPGNDTARLERQKTLKLQENLKKL